MVNVRRFSPHLSCGFQSLEIVYKPVRSWTTNTCEAAMRTVTASFSIASNGWTRWVDVLFFTCTRTSLVGRVSYLNFSVYGTRLTSGEMRDNLQLRSMDSNGDKLFINRKYRSFTVSPGRCLPNSAWGGDFHSFLSALWCNTHYLCIQLIDEFRALRPFMKNCLCTLC